MPVNYRGYIIGRVGNTFCVFKSAEAASEVNPIYTASKYYMALSWVDDVIARQGDTTTYYISAQKVKLDYAKEPQKSKKELLQEDAAIAFERAIHYFKDSMLFKSDFRTFLLVQEERNKGTLNRSQIADNIGLPSSITARDTLALSSIRRYLTNKYDMFVINMVETIIKNKPTKILEDLDLQSENSVILPEGKFEMHKILLQLGDTDVLLQKYDKETGGDWIIRTPAEVELSKLWKNNKYDIKYGDYRLYVYSLAPSIQYERRLRETEQHNKLIYAQRQAQAAMQERTAKENYDQIRVLAALQTVVNRLTPLQKQIIIVKYYTDEDLTFDSVALLIHLDTNYIYNLGTQAENQIEHDWESFGYNQFGSYKPYLHALADTQYGLNVLEQTKGAKE